MIGHTSGMKTNKVESKTEIPVHYTDNEFKFWWGRETYVATPIYEDNAQNPSQSYIKWTIIDKGGAPFWIMTTDTAYNIIDIRRGWNIKS